MTNLAVCAPARLARRGDGKSGTVGALELHELVERPDPLHRAHDRAEQRPLDAHREIDARRLVLGRVDVVDDVDAADERDAPVDVAQLAMQAPQAVRTELPWRHLRPVLEQRHAAAARSASSDARQVVLRAPAVDHHAHGDAALRGADQRRGDDAARRRRRHRCTSRARPRARRGRSRRRAPESIRRRFAAARCGSPERTGSSRSLGGIEGRGEGGVVGHPARPERVVDASIDDGQAPRVNPVEAEDR